MKGSNVLSYLSKQTYDVYNYKVLESDGQHYICYLKISDILWFICVSSLIPLNPLSLSTFPQL